MRFSPQRCEVYGATTPPKRSAIVRSLPEILKYLTEYQQRLVTQEKLIDGVWEVVMSDSVLRTHLSDLRRAIAVAMRRARGSL
jgi:DNA-binding winged helix-turn-helix (wHTH) protein